MGTLFCSLKKRSESELGIKTSEMRNELLLSLGRVTCCLKTSQNPLKPQLIKPETRSGFWSCFLKRSITPKSSRAPEILFKPELIGRDHCGIHESLFKSILSSDIDLRRSLLQNIVLSGKGSSPRIIFIMAAFTQLARLFFSSF